MGLAFVSIITYHFRRLVHIWLFQLISVGVQRITPISANETRARGLTRKRIHDHNPFHCFPFTCRLPSGWATGNESAEKLRQLNWKCPVHGLSVRKLNYDSSLDGNYRTYEKRKKKPKAVCPNFHVHNMKTCQLTTHEKCKNNYLFTSML